MTCTYYRYNRASDRRFVPDNFQPGEADRIAFDATADVDCAGAGVTITSATWEILAADVDANLTISSESISGLIVSALVTVQDGAPDKNYRGSVSIVTSDGRTLPVTFRIPVRSVRDMAA